jgi:hypothetical protein
MIHTFCILNFFYVQCFSLPDFVGPLWGIRCTYYLTVFISEKYKKEIESKCFKFIWNGKPDKVKGNTLIGDFEKGGLKMIDIESYFISLKASWGSKHFCRIRGYYLETVDVFSHLCSYKTSAFFSQIHLNILVVSVSISKILSQLVYLPHHWHSVM